MKDNKEVISEFNEYVNMTASELEKWLKSDDSNSAGWPKNEGDEGESVGHNSGRKIVEILKANPDKDPEKYTDDQVQHMRKVASYCKRHLAQEGTSNQEKDPEEVKKTKSYASLKNWGHDFLKAQGKAGSESKSGSKKEKKKDEDDAAEEEENENEEEHENEEEEHENEDEDNEKKENGERRKTRQQTAAQKNGAKKSNGKEQKEAEDEMDVDEDEDQEGKDVDEEKEEEDGGGDGDEDGDKKAGDKRKKNSQKQNGVSKKRQTAKGKGSKKDDDEGKDEKEVEEEEGKEEEKEEEDKDEEEGGGGGDDDGDSKAKTSKNGPKKGETVSWNWGSGNPKGKVLDVKEDKYVHDSFSTVLYSYLALPILSLLFHKTIVEKGRRKTLLKCIETDDFQRRATIETKNGNEVSRDGDSEDPAVVLDTGKSKAIKSAHELN